MEKKEYIIVGGPTLDEMFKSFETRQTRGTRFLVKKDRGDTEEVETDPCFIGSISYKDGMGTVFGIEGQCESHHFSGEYHARKMTGTITFS